MFRSSGIPQNIKYNKKEAGKRAGFTVFELIVIMIVIAVISIFVFISLNPYKGIRLNAAAQKVAADLLYTRNLALSTAKWYGVSFEVDPINTYGVYETDGTTDAYIENPARLGENFILNLNNYYGGVKIGGVSIAGGKKVEFSPLGRPYDDRTGSALVAAGAITIEYAGLTKTVEIAPNTGRINVR
jgi:Tfp pilus assembly protein FimT